ncbi:MAG: hypothetical protein ACOX4Z_00535 [Desulfobulbus sp.]|jgi:hypothetical protein
MPSSAQERMDLVAQAVQRWLRPSLPSAFMCPITGSIAFRRFQLLVHLRRQATLTAADQHLRHFQLVATIAAINKSPLGRLPGDAFYLRGRPGQGVAVIGGARLGLHAHDTIVTVSHPYTHLDSKCKLLMRLAFADAFHLGRMQAGEFVLVLPLLARQTLCQGKLRQKRSLQFGLTLDFPVNVPIHPTQKTFKRLISRCARFAWQA